jgi:hypothetical protein
MEREEKRSTHKSMYANDRDRDLISRLRLLPSIESELRRPALLLTVFLCALPNEAISE